MWGEVMKRILGIILLLTLISYKTTNEKI